MNSKEYLHPAMKDAVLQVLLASSPRGTVTSTYRSVAEQAQLRRAYDAGRAQFPAERPGQSTHHTGLSVDFVVPEGAHSSQQAQLGALWNSLGGKWSSRDAVHFEHPEARSAVNAGMVTPRWWL
jgi:LAS superfamily LD-carboxypeptidase LdcB